MATTAGTWLKRILLGTLVFVLVVLIAAIAFLQYKQVPRIVTGWAAEAVCAGAWVAGRDPQVILEEDVLGIAVGFSPALSSAITAAVGTVSVDIDEANHSVTARILGLAPRTAALQKDRGCVLDLPPDPAAQPMVPTVDRSAPWPRGDKPLDQADWPAGVDAAALTAVADQALVGAGDKGSANARAVAVVLDGQLLLAREAPGFSDGVPLLGWSMTKTVAGMLAYKLLVDNGVPLDTPVVDAFPAGREPDWVADWRSDERATITVRNLFTMTDGLSNVEGYSPFTDTVAMLRAEPDMAAYAAEAPPQFPPGTHFNYTSQTANILAAVSRGQLPTDEEYWAYPDTALFDLIGVESATLETDTAGNWVASSYLWADVADWARLGQLGLQDGRWNGTQVLPPGWLEFASTQALPQGEGAGYSAQAWLPGDPVGGECRNLPGFPSDMVAMEGHWGQKIAMVPSQKAVVVRLGATFDSDQFDYCTFWNEALAALPAPTP